MTMMFEEVFLMMSKEYLMKAVTKALVSVHVPMTILRANTMNQEHQQIFSLLKGHGTEGQSDLNIGTLCVQG